MANLERDAHEADSVYAFDPNEEDDADLDTSRLPLLIAIALVVLAAFAGVVWLAYTQGVEEGRADAPRIVAAQSHRAPPKPAANPYAGLNIYQPPASSDAGNEPIAPIPPRQTAPANSSQLPLRPSASATAEGPPAPARTAPPRQTSVRLAGPIAPTNSVPPKSDVGGAKAATPVQSSANSGSPAPDTAPAVQAIEAKPTAVSGSGVVLQIGSYKSDAEARHAWSAFKTRHAVAAPFIADVKEVDLGAKGVWYRLRIGAFQDRRAASGFCDKLETQGASCIVSR